MSKNTKSTKKKPNKYLDMISKYKLYIFAFIFLMLFVALYIIFGLKDKSYFQY